MKKGLASLKGCRIEYSIVLIEGVPLGYVVFGLCGVLTGFVFGWVSGEERGRSAFAANADYLESAGTVEDSERKMVGLATLAFVCLVLACLGVGMFIGATFF